MRGCPPCEITIGPSRIWLMAVWLAAAVAVAALLLWLMAAPEGGSWPVRAGVAGTVAVVLVLATTLTRRCSGVLRFTGTNWLWTPHGAESLLDRPLAGRVEVHVDVGCFMLLRFLAEPSGTGAGRSRWIPVDASSAMSSRHVFRCAAYSPRPTAEQAFPGSNNST